jgi:hypothetical protein
MFFKTISQLFLLQLIIAPAFAFQAYNPAEDHLLCNKKGYQLGRMEDVSTEQYYACRIEQALQQRIPDKEIKSSIEQDHNKNIDAAIQEFSQKANVARSQASQYARDDYSKWEEEQSTLTKQYNKQDHQTCITKTGSPSSWGSPNTERYYFCRAELIEKRASPTPRLSDYHEQKSSEAALYFYRLAREAQYAFRAIDYALHTQCLEKGTPGEIDDPQSEPYFRCRATLALKDQDQDVVKMFTKKAEQSKQAFNEHLSCSSRGFAKGQERYQHCRKAITHYNQCMGDIPNQLNAALNEAKKQCHQLSTSQFPDSLSQGNRQKLVSIDRFNQTSSTSIDSPAFMPKAALQKARQRFYSSCFKSKQSEALQWEAGFKARCSDLINFDLSTTAKP